MTDLRALSDIEIASKMLQEQEGNLSSYEYDHWMQIIKNRMGWLNRD